MGKAKERWFSCGVSSKIEDVISQQPATGQNHFGSRGHKEERRFGRINLEIPDGKKITTARRRMLMLTFLLVVWSTFNTTG
jgi:hypothetical protein